MIDDILEYNKKFVRNKEYEEYMTDRFPSKKIAVISCMDTRLIELLQKALGFKNGDVKIIKNAGGIITDPFGSEIKSILIGIYKLNVEKIMIIGHKECGAKAVKGKDIKELMIKSGIEEASIDTIKYCGVDVEKWIDGFESTKKSVEDTVNLIKKHPLIPKGIGVGGYIIDPVTGELETVIEMVEI